MKKKYFEHPATLIYKNGYWFVDCGELGTIDLGDDIPQSLELMTDIIEEDEIASPVPNNDFKKVCQNCKLAVKCPDYTFKVAERCSSYVYNGKPIQKS